MLLLLCTEAHLRKFGFFCSTNTHHFSNRPKKSSEISSRECGNELNLQLLSQLSSPGHEGRKGSGKCAYSLSTHNRIWSTRETNFSSPPPPTPLSFRSWDGLNFVRRLLIYRGNTGKVFRLLLFFSPVFAVASPGRGNNFHYNISVLFFCIELEVADHRCWFEHMDDVLWWKFQKILHLVHLVNDAVAVVCQKCFFFLLPIQTIAVYTPNIVLWRIQISMKCSLKNPLKIG